MSGGETACAHGRLAFGEGGALVVCLDCPDTWALIPREERAQQAPLGLGRGDVRLAPRLLGPVPAGTALDFEELLRDAKARG